ncbi:MAG: glycosyltransferase family 2 protein [Treponema sp.]|nr:glycosyltransferase family 2 protein [Treponema sp.]
MEYGFVVPVYNHGAALEGVVKNLSAHNIPIIIVDDGNNETNRRQINDVVNNYPLCTLVSLEKNSGKGIAMKHGLLKAHEMGLSYILQVDSDGQHDASRVSHFIEVSKANPGAIICGYPEYDESVPKKRLNGRKIANGWIHVVTLSNSIKDALIGFRVYPVKPYIKIINRHTYIDSRMGYDTDILVHLMWSGCPVINEPVKVFYPKDGISNFRMVRDNIRISLTYARLCLGMIIRIPVLLFRKIKG